MLVQKLGDRELSPCSQPNTSGEPIKLGLLGIFAKKKLYVSASLAQFAPSSSSGLLALLRQPFPGQLLRLVNTGAFVSWNSRTRAGIFIHLPFIFSTLNGGFQGGCCLQYPQDAD